MSFEVAITFIIQFKFISYFCVNMLLLVLMSAEKRKKQWMNMKVLKTSKVDKSWGFQDPLKKSFGDMILENNKYDLFRKKKLFSDTNRLMLHNDKCIDMH
jgi:hypothetical protein